MYTELKDFGYLIMWGVVAGLLLTWAIGKDGWDMHRRMVDNDVHNN